MPLSKFRKSKTFTAIRKFTDRERPIEVFWQAFENLRAGRKPLQVLVFFGIGGIGKTTLLKHIRSALTTRIADEDAENIRLVSLSLEAYEFDSPADVLMAFRNQLEISCHLFDYALLRYWALVGHSPLEIKTKFLKEGSIIWDILESMASLGGVPIPIKLLGKAAKKLRQKYLKTFSKYKEEFEEIENLEAFDLYQRLPSYLGLSLQGAFEEEGLQHVVFLDACETMLSKLARKSVSESADEWLRELIGSSGSGLFVVGSRESIHWEQLDKEWGDYLDQHILGELTDADANFFLRSVPIADEKIRATIIATARGVPLYLDLCVGIYIAKLERNEPPLAKDFVLVEQEVISRFLRHLSVAERELVRTLSAINFFDFPVLTHLVRKFNIGYPATQFTSFVEMSSVHVIDEDQGLYKIHDTVRAYVLDRMPEALRADIVGNAIEYFAQNKERYQPHLLAKHFLHLASITKARANLGDERSDAENLLDIGTALVDNGLWLEVYQAMSRCDPETGNHEGPLRNALGLMRAICLRRVSKLEMAYSELSKIQTSPESLGRYASLASFHKANITRLLGNYPAAERLYRDLAKEISRTRDLKLLTKVKRQWADLLLLKGEFKKALSVLKDLQQTAHDSFETAETLRIIGHVYRFNMQLDEAEEAYQEALRLIEGKGFTGLLGKLRTNLVETLCWKNPEQAIKAAPLALELNERLGARLEVGKIFAALSVAHVLENQDLELADSLAQQARSVEAEIGYLSGTLFAETAATISLMARHDYDQVVAKKKLVQKLIDKLGVYAFLMLPIYVYLDDRTSVGRVKRSFDWLNFNRTLACYRLIIESFGPNT